MTARSTTSGTASIVWYAATPETGSPRAIDRVGRSGEVAGDDVAEQLSADRPAPGRRPDHGNAAWSEERAQGGDDRHVIAVVDAVEVSRRGADRESHLDLAAVTLTRLLEPRSLQHAQHGPVLRQDQRHEDLDPEAAGRLGQLLEQPRAEPLRLHRVGHGEGHLGNGWVAQPRVARDRDDAHVVVAADRCHQRAALHPVRVEVGLDERAVHARDPVETREQARDREGMEEPHELVRIRPRRRTQPQGGPVPEDHVPHAGDGRRTRWGLQDRHRAVLHPYGLVVRP